jgi:CRP-like cAMP-binding protein
MPKQSTSATAPRNRLLARLPPGAYRDLLPLLQPVELPYGRVLYDANAAIDYAYFPADAILSALTVMQDGNLIEVATVGNEGLIGHYGFGGTTSPHRVDVQLAGAGHRIAARALQEAAVAIGPLGELLASYHIAFMTQVSQSVACNGLHRLEERCCRWLLMCRDRVGTDDIRLTHEYLAAMLGARRASVTDALRPLQEAGLLRSRRGRITLLDEAGLQARACECYLVVRGRYEQLLGEGA